MFSKGDMSKMGNNEILRLSEFSSETERAVPRNSRTLIGFYERRVAKERSFREINTRRSEWTRKKV